MFLVFSVLLFCFPFFLIGQQKELQPVVVEQEIPLQSSKKGNHLLSREFIVNKQADDVGDILKFIPGITLKNYGGLGGLKTISSRGINGNHIGVIIDGFLIQNNQVGQVDLSNIQVENTEEIRFEYLPTLSRLEPVGSYFNASNLAIQSLENKITKDTFQFKFNFKIGSFGLKDVYLSNKYTIGKTHFSWFAKYREADGDFTYNTSNLNHSIQQKRVNNDLKEVYTGLNFHYNLSRKSCFKIMTLVNLSDKGLPGAVILYNPTSSQRLKNNNFQTNTEYRILAKNFTNRTYLSHRVEQINYLDSGYLNSVGYLKSLYVSHQINGGSSFLFEKGNKTLILGVESSLSTLNSNQFDQLVFRHHEKIIADFNMNFKRLSLKLINGIQYVETFNKSVKEKQLNYSPSIGVYAANYTQIWGKLYAIAKRTLRMPSFSELFYNQIGNKDLKPEISNQITIGSDYEFHLKTNEIKVSYTVFSGLIENKIVAIPTKNLFIWSIQNIGKVAIYGSEVMVYSERKITDKLSLNLNANYTFQRILDITQKTGPTYLHQIAYIPITTLNTGIGLTLKNFGITLSSHYTANRYALNENISANLVQEFNLLDCTIFYQTTVKKQNFRVAVTLKNILNAKYEYIRNYAMPGRNFLINLSYAIR